MTVLSGERSITESDKTRISYHMNMMVYCLQLLNITGCVTPKDQ